MAAQFPDDPYIPLTDDPVDTLDYKTGRIPAVTRLSEACRLDFQECTCCLEGADEAVGKWLQSEMASRPYLALLERTGWREAAPFHVRAPLPAYQPCRGRAAVVVVESRVGACRPEGRRGCTPTHG